MVGTNFQLENILPLAGEQRKYKDFISASLSGLYLGRNNCKDLFKNDD